LLRQSLALLVSVLLLSFSALVMARLALLDDVFFVGWIDLKHNVAVGVNVLFIAVDRSSKRWQRLWFNVFPLPLL
jgi:hypothetical protein